MLTVEHRTTESYEDIQTRQSDIYDTEKYLEPVAFCAHISVIYGTFLSPYNVRTFTW